MFCHFISNLQIERETRIGPISVTIGISSVATSVGSAQWHGTGSAEPTDFLPGGTLVATMHRHLLFLQPHVGNQRVYLDSDNSGSDQQ